MRILHSNKPIRKIIEKGQYELKILVLKFYFNLSTVNSWLLDVKMYAEASESMVPFVFTDPKFNCQYTVSFLFSSTQSCI